jgi:formylglycine-generating enzyme
MRPPTQAKFHRTLTVLLASSTAFLGASLFATSAQASYSTAGSSCPSDMTLVGHTCVDKWEGSLVEVRTDGSEVPFSAHEAPNGHNVRAVSRPGVTPQAHISMVEAQHACKASGKRLCHAQEWKSACKGPEATRYPYGKSHEANVCVDTNRTSPMAVLHNGEHDAATMNDPEANQLSNTVEPTGSAAECTNAYGVYDMVGNVHEWADDGAFHGGYYLDTKLNGEGCDYTTTAHAKIYYDYSTGFRCCADEGTLEDTTPDELPAPPAKKEEAPAPRPMLHGAPGSDADDDDVPGVIGTNEVSDGDRRSLEPLEMMRRVDRKF